VIPLASAVSLRKRERRKGREKKEKRNENELFAFAWYHLPLYDFRSSVREGKRRKKKEITKRYEGSAHLLAAALCLLLDRRTGREGEENLQGGGGRPVLTPPRFLVHATAAGRRGKRENLEKEGGRGRDRLLSLLYRSSGTGYRKRGREPRKKKKRGTGLGGGGGGGGVGGGGGLGLGEKEGKEGTANGFRPDSPPPLPCGRLQRISE